MRRKAAIVFGGCAAALALCGPPPATAQYGFPDWIRLKDASAVPCRILSDHDGKVVAVMQGGHGEETVTIDRGEVEWLKRNSTPPPGKARGDGAPGDGAAPVARGSDPVL